MLVKLKVEQVKDGHLLLHSCYKKRLLLNCSKTLILPSYLLDKTPQNVFDILPANSSCEWPPPTTGFKVL